MRARSREHGGIGATVVHLTPITFRHPAPTAAPSGDAIFAPSAPAPAPTCPPGQHWEDTPTTLKGLGACVPNAAEPAPAPAATTASTMPVPQQACPAPWSLWWLLVAAGTGAFLGHYVAKNQKAAKKNAGRIANLAAARFVNAGVARLLG